MFNASNFKYNWRTAVDLHKEFAYQALQKVAFENLVQKRILKGIKGADIKSRI